MKKILILGVIGIFSLTLTSCGGNHTLCDAYRKADYTSYKAKKDIKSRVLETFTKQK